jgi:drug/metabolite transporter (DMT)-like permease
LAITADRNSPMSALATFFWVLDLLFDTIGHLALKHSTRRVAPASGLLFWRSVLPQPILWLGIGAFAAEFLAWLSFLSLVPLSKGVLVGSVNILAVMIGGRIFFRERVTAARAAAGMLIATGVALVGWAGP